MHASKASYYAQVLIMQAYGAEDSCKLGIPGEVCFTKISYLANTNTLAAHTYFVGAVWSIFSQGLCGMVQWTS